MTLTAILKLPVPSNASLADHSRSTRRLKHRRRSNPEKENTTPLPDRSGSGRDILQVVAFVSTGIEPTGWAQRGDYYRDLARKW